MNVHVFSQQRQDAQKAEMVTHVRLGMAALSPDGLSEQWLLRSCGDLHWCLIATALGQEKAVFHDKIGRPVYAAFCATLLKLLKTEASLLGEDIIIKSELFRVGYNQLGSIHSFCIADSLIAFPPLGKLQMISTFVSHDGTGSNRSIIRNEISQDINVPPCPVSLCELYNSSRNLRRKLKGQRTQTTPILSERPCPQLDFNAVGLLYFPTFSKLAEKAEWQLGCHIDKLVERKIVYFGNIDQGDEVCVLSTGGALNICRLDGNIIAHVETVRETRQGARLHKHS